MPALITLEGIIHWSQLDAGQSLDHTFNRLILDKGNASTSDTDTTDTLADQVSVSVLDVLPVRGATDPANTGSGPAIYTWSFRVSGGSTPVVASSVALTTGDPLPNPLAIHADDVVWTEPYRDLLVWFNLGAGSATMVTSFVYNPVEAARLRSSGQTANILHGGRGSQVMRPDHVYTTVNAGEQVVLRARLYGIDELPLRPTDVQSVTVVSQVEDAANGRWVDESRRALTRCMIEIVDQGLSAKFPYRGGFNFEYIHTGTLTRDGRSRRLLFDVLLWDGSKQRITQEVRVRS